MILVAIMLPQFSGARRSARDTGSLSNIRHVGVAVTGYAGDYAGCPPVIFRPEALFMSMQPLEHVDFGEYSIEGAWFFNAVYFHHALSPLLPAETLFDPAAPREVIRRVRRGNESTAEYGDYIITQTLYAARPFWNVRTQSGPSQFQPQPLDTIAFPSQKGLARQSMQYARPPSGWLSCCETDVPAPVLWADLAAQRVVQRTLLPGVPNGWHHGLAGAPSVWDVGVPVDMTPDGVYGRDR